MYYWAFSAFHKLLQTRFGITLKWRHLDPDAPLIAVVADQDPKQIAGKYFKTGCEPILKWI
jgi:hypothetical protein